MANFFKAKKTNVVAQSRLEIAVDHFNHDGDGVGYSAGKICFVQGALPGEKVVATLVEDKAKVRKAHCIKVLQAAPQRITPQCQHFSQCGGCQLQYVGPDQQLVLKQQAVTALFKRFVNLDDLPWQTSIRGQPWHYRRAARIGVWYERKTQQFTVGFRQRNSKFLTAIDHCPVLVKKFSTLFSAFTQLLPELTCGPHITHLEVLQADAISVVVVRHTKPMTQADKDKLCLLGQANQWVIIGESEKDQFDCLNGDPIPALTYQLPGYDSHLSFRIGDFIQVNAEVNQQMVSQAQQWLDLQSQDVLLDLFCGIGNFSLPLATVCAKVVGIEGVEAMVLQATLNASSNGISNAKFYQADLSAEIGKHQPSWLSERFTKVLLDPARAGAQAMMVPITRLKPAKIVYVSCDPLTLARDSATLVKSGYQLQQIALMDMFCHTRHVEVMALFESVSARKKG